MTRRGTFSRTYKASISLISKLALIDAQFLQTGLICNSWKEDNQLFLRQVERQLLAQPISLVTPRELFETDAALALLFKGLERNIARSIEFVEEEAVRREAEALLKEYLGILIRVIEVLSVNRLRLNAERCYERASNVFQLVKHSDDTELVLLVVVFLARTFELGDLSLFAAQPNEQLEFFTAYFY